MSLCIFHLLERAAKGDFGARVALGRRREAVQRQHDEDRRLRNATYAVELLKARGQEPQTCQEWADVLRRYGYDPVNHLPAALRKQPMRLDQFVAAAGGFSSRLNYTAKGDPDAPSKCEGCRKHGTAGGGSAGARCETGCTCADAHLRCCWCGEWYCSPDCFFRDLPGHITACAKVVDIIHRGLPPTPTPELWSAQLYADVYGLATPAAAVGGGSRGRGRGSGSSRGNDGAAAAGPLSRYMLLRPPDASELEAELAKAGKQQEVIRLEREAARRAKDVRSRHENDQPASSRTPPVSFMGMGVQQQQQQQQQGTAAAAAAAASGEPGAPGCNFRGLVVDVLQLLATVGVLLVAVGLQQLVAAAASMLA